MNQNEIKIILVKILKIVIVLFLLGMLGKTLINNKIQNSTVQMAIFIEVSASDEEIAELRGKLESNEKIKNIQYESREDALNSMKKKFKNLLSDEDRQIFPARFIVEVKKEEAEEIKNELEKNAIVTHVGYDNSV